MRVYIIVAGLVLSIIGRGSATVVDKGTDAQRSCELLVQNSFRNQDEARSAGDAANNVVALSVRTPPRTIESRCMSPEVAHLGHGGMSDLSPLCVPMQTSQKGAACNEILKRNPAFMFDGYRVVARARP